MFSELTAEGCGLERVGNKGGEDYGMECERNPSQVELQICSGVSLQVS
jgi:hypothetical protein